MHCNHNRRDANGKTASGRSLRNPIGVDPAAAVAVVFRFLRRPNKPTAPRSVVKRGSAAGSGVVASSTSSVSKLNSHLARPNGPSLPIIVRAIPAFGQSPVAR